MGTKFIRLNRWERIRIGNAIVRVKKTIDETGQVLLEIDAPPEIEIEHIKPAKPWANIATKKPAAGDTA